MVGGIVLTHGHIASAIVDAAGTIIGKTEKIFTLSTSNYSLRSLVEELEMIKQELLKTDNSINKIRESNKKFKKKIREMRR